MYKAVVIAFVVFHIVLSTVSAADEQPYMDLILRARDCNTGNDEVEPGCIEKFLDTSRQLDSLLGIYVSMDTLSGFIGQGRVLRIAACYTKLAMYEDARKWWMLLGRIDKRDYFERETQHGLLRCGVALADSNMLSGLLNGTDFWKDTIKCELGAELIAALRILDAKGADGRWLEKRFERLKKYFPYIDATLFQYRQLSKRGSWGQAFEVCRAAAKHESAAEISSIHAKLLIKALFSSSLLCGLVDEAKTILAGILEHGSEEMILSARRWLAGVYLLEGERGKALESFKQLCAGVPDGEMSCFWHAWIERYMEVSTRLPG